MPFEEIQHTADWSIRVWAANLADLFAEAARGMNTLSSTRLAPRPRVKRTFEAFGPDAESLLVAFLSELVYAAEKEHLAFDEFDIKVLGQELKVKMSGASLVSVEKAIKAVTFHNLQIWQTERGCEMEIVFDV